MINKEETRKIVLAGDISVGKTSIISSFLNSDGDINSTRPTVGAQTQTYTYKDENNKEYIFHIWDTAGGENYDSLRAQYFRNCDGAIVVYDVNKPETFDHVSKWIKQVQDNSENCQISILGNKIDLRKMEEKEKYVSSDQLQNFCDKTNYLYFEVSALTRENIDNSFNALFQRICEQVITEPVFASFVDLKAHEEPKKCPKCRI